MDEVYTSDAPVDIACLLITTLWAQLRSKDPRTRVGAAVYDPISGGIYLGYNGFNAGVPDLKSIWDNRDPLTGKLQYVLHAEGNSIRKAVAALGSLEQCVLYVTHFPCGPCMRDHIIPSQLKHVVYLNPRPDKLSEELARACDIEVVRSMLDVDVVNECTKDWAEWPKTITITERKSELYGP